MGVSLVVPGPDDTVERERGGGQLVRQTGREETGRHTQRKSYI